MTAFWWVRCFLLSVAILFLSAGAIANSGIDLINLARTKNGLVPFKSQSQLEKAARGHVHYMAINQVSAHDQELGRKGYTGRSCAERAVAAGYLSRKCSENLSYGESAWSESVEHLFSAIYHRIGFLSFDFDEIGMAVEKSAVQPKTDEAPYYYAYVMGNSALRKVCSQKSVGTGYYGMCRDEGLVISEPEYKKAESAVLKKCAGTAIYPWDGQNSTPPFFENNEQPDPVPGLEITGQPVSIQFNPQHFENKKIIIESFHLRDHKNNAVALLPQKDKVSDSYNGKFTEFDFAWFPEKPLLWDTAYRVSLKYRVNGVSHNKEWSFRTKALPFRHKTVVTHPGQRIKVRADVEYAIILSPELSHSRIMGVNLDGCGGSKCSLNIRDINVVSAAQRGNTTLTFHLKDGTNYSVFFSAH